MSSLAVDLSVTLSTFLRSQSSVAAAMAIDFVTVLEAILTSRRPRENK